MTILVTGDADYFNESALQADDTVAGSLWLAEHSLWLAWVICRPIQWKRGAFPGATEPLRKRMQTGRRLAGLGDLAWPHSTADMPPSTASSAPVM